jgi:hypothetical protein
MAAMDAASTEKTAQSDLPGPEYFRPAEVGLLSWPGESIAVSYCGARAATHLVDEVANVVLSSFEGGMALTPSGLAKTFRGANSEEDSLIEERVGQTMQALAKIGLLRRNT